MGIYHFVMISPPHRFIVYLAVSFLLFTVWSFTGMDEHERSNSNLNSSGEHKASHNSQLNNTVSRSYGNVWSNTLVLTTLATGLHIFVHRNLTAEGTVATPVRRGAKGT